MFTDIAGFTKLAAEHEEKALALLEIQRDVLKPIVSEFNGKWLKEIGDGLLLSFPSSKQAVRCAVKMQHAVRVHPDLRLRIGIHQGDVLEQDGDVFGDDVNIASRIEPFAAAGGIAITHKVLGDISGSPEFVTKYVGKPKLKGVSQHVEVYCIVSHGLPMTRRSQVAAKLEKSRLRWGIYALGLILIGIAVLWMYGLKESIDRAEFIAVLPLENLSDDPDQEYFADGMTEALINELSRYGALHVISRHSVMQYKGSNLPVPEIGKDLGADVIVEGSVFKEGDSVRVSVGLIRASMDQSIWRREFDRKLGNILSLHKDLARAISDQINVSLTPQESSQLESVRLIDPMAYDAYMKGRFHWYRFTPQDMAKAVEYYEFALQRDPGFAAAYVGWADAVATPAHMGFIPTQEVYARAREAVLHALELDENLAEAHDMLGRIHFAYDWAPVSAEKDFKRAIELNPNNPDVRAVYSQLLSALGRHAEAIEQASKAVELDPLNDFARMNLLNRRAVAGQIDEVISIYLSTEELGIGPEQAHFELWDLLFRKGDDTRALAHAQGAWRQIGDTALVAALAPKHARESYQEIMTRAAELLVSRSESMYVSPFRVAMFFAHAGENELALDWLEKAIDVRDTQIVYIKLFSAFYKLEGTERFRRIEHRIKLG